MNLVEILQSLGIRDKIANVTVSSVTEDIAKVKEGSLFFAVKGRNTDGNRFINKAFDAGAVAVISSEKYPDARVFTVNDVREALSVAACKFYFPSRDKMQLIGITGTNGKSSTAGYLRHIINSSGRKCAVIGTLGSVSDDDYTDTGYTTPAAEILYSELEKHALSGNEYCVLEVSSQALAMKRTHALRFSLGIFTNLGTDHLDWHKSREEYMKAKKLLFNNCDKALVNADDCFKDEFCGIASEGTYLYSLKDDYADYTARNIRIKKDEISYLMLDEYGLCKIRFNANGEFSVYNSLAAAAGANILGITHSDICEAVHTLPVIKGRMEKISARGIDVYIDFAHTPEALENALKALKTVTKRKLICVFGCGGDRDKSKRSLMGAVASEYADIIVLTSDNPRGEDPSDIISDIIIGIKNINKIYKEIDREKAVALALKKAKDGDIVLIAGKGHENYMICSGEKKYFSDEITVKKILGV